MKPENILPAVMLSVAAMSSIASSAMANNTVTKTTETHTNLVPAVLFTETHIEFKDSDRLLKYEQNLMKNTGYKIAKMREDLGRCGTIGGSGKDWDQSKQDC
jgi:hypothetical protein